MTIYLRKKTRKKERKWEGGGRKDGWYEGVERGGKERKEGTEALGSFDLWSPWLHSVPRVKGSTPETSQDRFQALSRPSLHWLLPLPPPPEGDRSLSWPIPGHIRQL